MSYSKKALIKSSKETEQFPGRTEQADTVKPDLNSSLIQRALANTRSASNETMLQLQQIIGNRAVQRLLTPKPQTLASSVVGKPIQRMVLPLEDLTWYKHRKILTAEQKKEARIITNQKKKIIKNKRRKDVEGDVAHVETRLVRHDKPVENSLRFLGDNEKLYILGHGTIADEDSMIAEEFGGFSPEALATALVNAGITPKYQGEIYLNGCQTGGGEDSYAHKFQRSIAEKGIFVPVKANKSESVTNESGKTGVSGAATHRELMELKARLHVINTEMINLKKEVDKLLPIAEGGDQNALITIKAIFAEYNLLKQEDNTKLEKVDFLSGGIYKARKLKLPTLPKTLNQDALNSLITNLNKKKKQRDAIFAKLG